LKLEPNGYNQTALAALLLQRNTPKDSQDAFNLASSAAKTLPDDEQTNLVLLMSAAAVNNVPVARQADQHLLAIAPDSYLGHYFAGLLAGASGNWEEAETQLKTAQSLGMSAATVQHALDEGISTKAAFSRVLRWGAIATVLWLLGLGIIYLLGSYLSKATIRALNDAQPAVEAQIGPAERRIRSIYRALIGVLSVYFYISIPFVVLLLLLLVGGIFYVFMVIGTIPIQLSIILVLMVFASLIAIARGLFSRRKDLPPGRRLERSDAPELWSLVEEVAHKLDT
jgi:hypothetical protein